MSWRSSLRSGTSSLVDPEERRTSARIYAFDVGVGIWRGLSARMVLPLLDASFSTATESGRAVGLGDLSLTARYQLLDGRPWSAALAAGAYLPTGDQVRGDIPSNPNFVSGTVDPVFAGEAGYDFRWGLGLYLQAFWRAVAYESDGYRAGHSLTYGGGMRFRIWRSLLPSFGLTALHRLQDHKSGAPQSDTGGDWLYVSTGASYLVIRGPLAGAGIGFQLQLPVYQRLNGMQLAEDVNLTLFLSYGFQLFGGLDSSGPLRSDKPAGGHRQ
jgi:hypothetical protein